MNESTLVPREEMSDLDWLARNVHVWPAGDHQPWCYVYMAHGGVMKAAGNFLDAVAKPTMITKDQWHARRAELQNKPSWDDAPEWARWLAKDSPDKDEESAWWWYADKPVSMKNTWQVSTDGRAMMAASCHCDLGDWRDTLEKWLADLSEQAVMSRLQEDTYSVLAAAPGLMSDKYKFEPFVSVEDAATSKQQEITASKYTKTIRGVSVDVYDVLQAWGVSNPALQHLIKKALQCGQRGHKDSAQDLQDIIDSAIRAKELEL